MAVKIDSSRIGIEAFEVTNSVQDSSRDSSRPKKNANLTIFTFDSEKFCRLEQVDRHVKSATILDKLYNWLNLSRLPDQPFCDAFSLWMASPSLELQLKSDHEPIKLYKKWAELLTQYTTVPKEQCALEKPRLYLRRNVFMTLEKEKQIVMGNLSREILSLLYHEAVCNVNRGNYPPLTKEEVMELASFQCAVEYRGQQIDTAIARCHLPPYVHTTSAASAKTLDQLKKCGLEKDLVSAYQSCVGGSSSSTLSDEMVDEYKRKYLEKCWDKDYYGCVMFRGLVERKKTSNPLNFLVYRDRPVIIAVNLTSLHILNGTSKEVMLSLRLSHGLSCQFQPATEEGEYFYSSIWLEFETGAATVSDSNDKESKRLQIFSRQAPLVDAMVNRCLCEEMQRTDNQASSTNSVVTSCSRSTKAFVCERYKVNPETGDKVKLSLLPSFRRSSKTTVA